MYRNTIQRETILRILRNTRSHPTADDIYHQVRKEIANISKGTVYRNLQVLQALGQVKELNLNGTISRFEIAQPNHYHFRCEHCGGVIDIDEPVDTEIDCRVAERTGSLVTHHQTEFRGLCRQCRHTQRYRRKCMAVKKAG